jgi:putative ABC transport system permease protein
VGGTGQRPGRRRLALAALLAIAGLVLAVMGLTSDSGGSSATALVGFGAVAMLLGVALLSPVLVKPLAAVAGWPMERIRGLTGRLARENALRKPGRTASTAAALMIGLALVVFVTVFGAGISASVGKAIDDNFRGDLVLQNTDGFSQISAKAPPAAAEVEGVGTVSSLSFASGSMREPVRKTVRLTGAEPDTASDTLALDWKEGSAETLSNLGPDEAVLDDATARDVGLEVGDTMAIRTSLGETATYTVRGIAEDRADLLGDALVDSESLRADFGTRAPSFTFVKVAEGQDVAAVQERVTQALGDRYPTVEVFNNEELKEEQERQIGQLIAMFYALLALAVIVSVMGIAITLMLSIHERTRELGLLRAVGMSRRQVRSTMRYEAVITALIGAVLGTVMGVVFAALVSRPLADQGFELAYPIGTLLILLVVAAVAGVLAAIYPARRAARLDVLKALAYE